jgi:hypothetical protein
VVETDASFIKGAGVKPAVMRHDSYADAGWMHQTSGLKRFGASAMNQRETQHFLPPGRRSIAIRHRQIDMRNSLGIRHSRPLLVATQPCLPDAS